MPTLKDTIDRIVYESTLPNSVFKNADEIMVSLYAKEGLSKLNLTFLQGVRGMNFKVPNSCIAFFPVDYMGYIRAYIINCDGKTIELNVNRNIPNVIKNFMMDCDGSIVLDCDETELYSDCIECNSSDEYTSTNKDCDTTCNVCHGSGKYLSTEARQFINDMNRYQDAWVKIHEAEKYIEFSAELEGTAVMIEYMSNNIHTISECSIEVPEKYMEILDYYIKYKILESDIDLANRAGMYYQKFKALRDKEIVNSNPLTTDDIYKALLKNKN